MSDNAKAVTKYDVAHKFKEIICKYISTADVKEIDRLNAAEVIGSGVCHTHDFCDANLIMEEALTSLGVKVFAQAENSHDPDDQVMSDEAISLWDAAWDIAKAEGFSTLPAETPTPTKKPVKRGVPSPSM